MSSNVRNGLLVMGCVVLLSFVGYFTLCLTVRRADAVTLENFQRITAGMTKEEAVKLLGAPTWSTGGRMPLGQSWSEHLYWRGHNGMIALTFSGNDPFSAVPYLLTEKEFYEEDNDDFFDRLRRWLRISE
jgi:hypothetical protein